MIINYYYVIQFENYISYGFCFSRNILGIELKPIIKLTLFIKLFINMEYYVNINIYKET